MKKTLSFLFVSSFALSALASEVDDVQARIARDGYPMPLSISGDLVNIEKELTPAPTSETWEAVSAKKGWFCDEETIRIFYRLDESSPVESFLATMTLPARLRSKVPAVVIQPTLAGPTVLERDEAKDLCHSGFIGIVPNETMLDLPAKLPDFTAYDRNMRVEMIRARRIVDFLSQDARVQGNKIGAIGFSRGAIAGALLIGIEPRIHYAFLGAGGVGIGKIIPRSQTERGLADTKRHMEAAGMTLDQFEEKLVQTVRYDGILFAHRFPAERLKIMTIEDDTSVSAESQELLRSFGGPFAFKKKGTHVGEIVKEVFLRDGEYLKFFKEQARGL